MIRAYPCDPPDSEPTDTGIHRRLVALLALPNSEGCTTLPVGFVWNQASVSKWVPRWIIEPRHMGDAATAEHDALCEHDGALPVEWCEPYRRFTPDEAADLLYQRALMEGCPRWRAMLACWLVRRFGPRW